MKLEQLPAAVRELHTLNIEGNIIPHTWYRAVTFDNGKPDLNGVVILAEILYWYRPTVRKSESNPHAVTYDKRFEADKLQRSYESFAEQFGISKLEAKNACQRLAKRGLITIEFRDVTTKRGQVLRNVMFVEPVAQAVWVISFKSSAEEAVVSTSEGMHFKVTTFQSDHLLECPRGHFGMGTYTETTTETGLEERERESGQQPVQPQVVRTDQIESQTPEVRETVAAGTVAATTAALPLLEASTTGGVPLLPRMADGTRHFTDKELKAVDDALERMGRFREHARKDELFACRHLFTNGCSVDLFRQITDEVFNDPAVVKVTSLKLIVWRCTDRQEKVTANEQSRNRNHPGDASTGQSGRGRYPSPPASRSGRAAAPRGGAPAASRVQHQDREHAAEYDWDAL